MRSYAVDTCLDIDEAARFQSIELSRAGGYGSDAGHAYLSLEDG